MRDEKLDMLIANAEYEPQQLKDYITNLQEENELHNKILKQANDVLNLQTEEGNYNYDRFMLGVYNGMEAIVSLFEQREPKFKCEENIKFLHETDYKSRNEKAIKKLKEHKHDLDYEPWSIYKIEGNILFDLKNILQGEDK